MAVTMCTQILPRLEVLDGQKLARDDRGRDVHTPRIDAVINRFRSRSMASVPLQSLDALLQQAAIQSLESKMDRILYEKLVFIAGIFFISPTGPIDNLLLKNALNNNIKRY